MGDNADATAWPVAAEVVRGGFVEGRHRGAVVVLRGSDALFEVGPVDLPMLPRSSAKPLQAKGMLDCGLQVDDAQLALVCGSHTGEQMHVDGVRKLLAGVGLDESALDNTASMPGDSKARRARTVAGEGPARITHSCSGKHAGMLATCVAAGWPTAGYRDPAHPLQVRLREVVSELTGDPVTATLVDGCGAPLFAVTLRGLARGFAAVATAEGGTNAGRCAAAMRAHPELVAGTGHVTTTLMQGAPGLVAKDGAEGVYAVAFADGTAAAVKIDDGASRAQLPVLVEALRRCGITDPAFDAAGKVDVLGHGEPVGEVRAAF
ncbi:MAG TPA: asparaginase [Mycobacteriales bacterium]|nr:asparaginase [Mycobacteriales bacterium]HVV76606.1 asparaginase [Mycobacteriales bacterium]